MNNLPTAPNFRPGPWKQGKTAGSIIADVTPENANKLTSFFDEIGYYGGPLIAESVFSSNLTFICAAPDMYHVLVMMRDADEDCKMDNLQRLNPTARRMIDLAIAKAEGKEAPNA